MRRRIVVPALAALVTAAIAATTMGSADGTSGPPGVNSGPPYVFVTELIRYNVTPLKNQAVLMKTSHGYRFRTGQQRSHLVVTRVKGGLRFVDRGTDRFKKRVPAACRRKNVRVGVAAVCRVPGGISVRKPLLIEVWPRLGNDYTDTSTLPATFAVTMVSDKGNDVARFGAGPDFFNGFSGGDRVSGGAGNDWIRGGLGNDTINGGPGHDDIVTKEGRDAVRGGSGIDRLWSGDGDDRLGGGAGVDFLLCGNGRDRAKAGVTDRVARNCESVG